MDAYWENALKQRSVQKVANGFALRGRLRKQKADKEVRNQQKVYARSGGFVGTYQDYIKSPQWARKRQRVIRYYKSRCTVCGSRERLVVHHRHYRTLFREGMKDLDLLCDGCHRNTHESEKTCAADPMTAEFLSLKL